MVEVKPDEISAILREQLSGIKSEAELEEVGTVLQIGDGIARIYGLTKAKAGELVQFENGVKAIVLNLEEDNVGAVLLGPSGNLKEGTSVKRTGKIATRKGTRTEPGRKRMVEWNGRTNRGGIIFAVAKNSNNKILRVGKYIQK